VGCSRYPECRYTVPIGAHNAPDSDGEETSSPPSLQETKQPKVLGIDPVSSQEVSLRTGPYGPYVQLESGSAKEKPKRIALPKGISVDGLTLEQALRLLSLPRHLGKHPETGEDLSVGIGRFGPFIKKGDRFISLKEVNILDVTLPQVLEFLEKSKSTPKEEKKGSRKKKTE
jgi:DNA topoisomerase-1